MSGNTIIRAARNGENPYAQITRAIFEDPRISWRAKGVIGYLLSRKDGWQVMIKDLQNRSTDGRDACYKALDELGRAGYLDREELRGEKGRIKGYSYVIHEVPDASRTASWKSVSGKSVSGETVSGESAPSNKGFKQELKEIRTEETETDGAQDESAPPVQVPVSAEGQDQDISTGAADAARVNTPTPPLQKPEPPTASGRAPNATRSKDGPGAAGVIHSSVDNFPDGPCRKFLLGAFGGEWLGRLIEEDPSRSDWFALSTDTFQASKDDALTTSVKGKWKSALIGLLDAETASLRRARRPAPVGQPPAQSVNDMINARIAATKRAE